MGNGPTQHLDARQREIAKQIFGDDLGRLIALGQRMKEQDAGAAPQAQSPASPEAFRQIARIAFEDTDRGKRSRAAWHQVLAGALELVKIWSEDRTSATAP